MTYPTISADPAVQRHYCVCRARGTSHNLAMIFATGKAPGSVTDKEFLAGRGTLRDQFGGDEVGLKEVVKRARQQGYEPKASDVYLPGLANSVGDPLAFVPPGDARGHVKRVCEMRGDACYGMVKVKAREVGPPPDDKPGIAPDIVERHVNAQIKRDPSLSGKKAELCEAFIERHAPKP
jgi:hypothetical protein